jgi:hypothetical protein
MHRPYLAAVIAVLVVSIGTSVVWAQVDANSAEMAAARRELAVAKIEANHYWQVEYPRRRRELNAEITFVDAELRAMKELLREYGPFSRFSTGQPLFLPIQDLKLCILDAELRLRALRDERINLVRFHSEEGQLLDLRVADARARLVALEGGGVIEFEAGE